MKSVGMLNGFISVSEIKSCSYDLFSAENDSPHKIIRPSTVSFYHQQPWEFMVFYRNINSYQQP